MTDIIDMIVVKVFKTMRQKTNTIKKGCFSVHGIIICTLLFSQTRFMTLTLTTLTLPCNFFIRDQRLLFKK